MLYVETYGILRLKQNGDITLFYHTILLFFQKNLFSSEAGIRLQTSVLKECLQGGNVVKSI